MAKMTQMDSPTVRRSDIQQGSHRAKVKGSAGLTPCLFQLLEAARLPQPEPLPAAEPAVLRLSDPTPTVTSPTHRRQETLG